MNKIKMIISVVTASTVLFTGCELMPGTSVDNGIGTVSLEEDEIKNDSSEENKEEKTEANVDSEDETANSENENDELNNEETNPPANDQNTEVIVSKSPRQQNTAGKDYSFSEYVNGGYMLFALGEGDVNQLLDTDRYDGSEEWYYISVDMDKDGFEEMFVEVSTDVPYFSDSGICGDLWFVDDTYTRRFETENYEEYLKEASFYDYGNEVKVIINYTSSAVNMDGYVFEVKDNMIQYPFLNPGQKFFNPNGTLDIIVENYNANKTVENGVELWLGHTWIPHTYKFEADEWVPLETEEITEQEAAAEANFIREDLIPEDEEIITFLRREDQYLIIVTEKKDQSGTSFDYTTYILAIALDKWAVSEKYAGIY